MKINSRLRRGWMAMGDDGDEDVVRYVICDM